MKPDETQERASTLAANDNIKITVDDCFSEAAQHLRSTHPINPLADPDVESAATKVLAEWLATFETDEDTRIALAGAWLYTQMEMVGDDGTSEGGINALSMLMGLLDEMLSTIDTDQS